MDDVPDPLNPMADGIELGCRLDSVNILSRNVIVKPGRELLAANEDKGKVTNIRNERGGLVKRSLPLFRNE